MIKIIEEIEIIEEMYKQVNKIHSYIDVQSSNFLGIAADGIALMIWDNIRIDVIDDIIIGLREEVEGKDLHR